MIMTNTWNILGVIALILLIIFWKRRGAAWGGLTLGLIIGLIIAIIKPLFDWSLIQKAGILGVYFGILIELLF